LELPIRQRGKVVYRGIRVADFSVREMYEVHFKEMGVTNVDLDQF